MVADELTRCGWVPLADPLYVAYHDDEWGVPTHDDRELFELLTLEGAQAGLSWSTILRKREGYRAAFAGFDAGAGRGFGDATSSGCMGDAGIVRNRAKIQSTSRTPAHCSTLDELGSLRRFLWSSSAGSARQRVAHGRRPPGRDAGVDRDVEGAEAARLPLRRPDHAATR